MPPQSLVATLLTWADASLRDLPWRRTRDPWAVLVAETMLQQTQVSRAEPKWRAFLDAYADPAACAAAPRADVIRLWAGLGYNRRAVNLHRAAEAIVADHGGRVPHTLPSLLGLPGVGPYTARAVLAFAHERPVAPVDTNIGRVLARFAGSSLTAREVQQRADALVPPSDPWLWNQGIMELGALVCTKRVPDCARCPVVDHCAWHGEGDDPATGSAAVSAPQARFEGSDRQLRGRLVDAVRAADLAVADLMTVLGTDDAERAERTLGGLVRDGLLEVEAGTVRLGR
ncbi:MAG: A/G-specific adenine glycosylase [Acidimicrobiales bacterium]|nr:A/G-specific adenine glycosylase [Acidimicrobiales bacterium]